MSERVESFGEKTVISSRHRKANFINIYGNKTKKDQCIAYCNLYAHPGYLTEQLIKEHECLKKQCPYLEKFHGQKYWIKREKHREELKEKRKSKKLIEEKRQFIKNHAKCLTANLGYVKILAVTHENGLFTVCFSSPKPHQLVSKDIVDQIKNDCACEHLRFKRIKPKPISEGDEL